MEIAIITGTRCSAIKLSSAVHKVRSGPSVPTMNGASVPSRYCLENTAPSRSGQANGGARRRSGTSSRRAARLPVVLKAVVEVAASQGNDGVGCPDRPEHAGLFETRADYGLAAGFDDA